MSAAGEKLKLRLVNTPTYADPANLLVPVDQADLACQGHLIESELTKLTMRQTAIVT
jgi:hypothetical protein